MATSAALRLGQRVWVAGVAGRTLGRIASLPPVLLGGVKGFAVLLDSRRTPTVITCEEERRGEQWDFADESESPTS